MAYPFCFKSKSQIEFPFVKDTQVILNFDGDLLSSDGGVLLLREVEDKLGIVKQLSDQLKDTRDARYVQHSLYDQFLQRVLLIASGYEDANDSDVDRLREDAAFKMALGRRPDDDLDLASQPTISRFENNPSRSELYRMAKVFADFFIKSYTTPPPAIILDFDDTESEVYGNQQLSLFNGYYGSTCYLPLHVYEALSGKLVTTILKPGQRANGKQMLAIIKRIVGHIRQAWPNTNIFIRGDSHFAYPETMAWIEEQNMANQPDEPVSDEDDLIGQLYYITGLSSNAVLKRNVQPTVDQALEIFQETQQPICIYHEFTYQAETWSKPRRVYGKIKVDKKGYKVHFRVTNIRHMRPSVMEEKVYNPRANCELRIKAHKLDLKSDRTSCHRFEANQFRLFLHSAAYVLMHALSTQVLKATSLAKASFQTIRLLLLKIAVRIKLLKTRIKVEFPKAHPNLNLVQRCFSIMDHVRRHAPG